MRTKALASSSITTGNIVFCGLLTGFGKDDVGIVKLNEFTEIEKRSVI